MTAALKGVSREMMRGVLGWLQPTIRAGNGVRHLALQTSVLPTAALQTERLGVGASAAGLISKWVEPGDGFPQSVSVYGPR